MMSLPIGRGTVFRARLRFLGPDEKRPDPGDGVLRLGFLAVVADGDCDEGGRDDGGADDGDVAELKIKENGC